MHNCSPCQPDFVVKVKREVKANNYLFLGFIKNLVGRYTISLHIIVCAISYTQYCLNVLMVSFDYSLVSLIGFSVLCLTEAV